MKHGRTTLRIKGRPLEPSGVIYPTDGKSITIETIDGKPISGARRIDISICTDDIVTADIQFLSSEIDLEGVVISKRTLDDIVSSIVQLEDDDVNYILSRVESIMRVSNAVKEGKLYPNTKKEV